MTWPRTNQTPSLSPESPPWNYFWVYSGPAKVWYALDMFSGRQHDVDYRLLKVNAVDTAYSLQKESGHSPWPMCVVFNC